MVFFFLSLSRVRFIHFQSLSNAVHIFSLFHFLWELMDVCVCQRVKGSKMWFMEIKNHIQLCLSTGGSISGRLFFSFLLCRHLFDSCSSSTWNLAYQSFIPFCCVCSLTDGIILEMECINMWPIRLIESLFRILFILPIDLCNFGTGFMVRNHWN